MNIRTQWSNLDANKAQELDDAKQGLPIIRDYLTANDGEEIWSSYMHNIDAVIAGSNEYYPVCFSSRICDNCDYHNCADNVGHVSGGALFQYKCRKKLKDNEK